MSKKIKESQPSKIAASDHHQRNPSPGFLLVAIGLVSYILYAAKFVTFTWLFPIAVASVITGFVMLIVETLGKIKFH